jgi:hypothetical protein
MASEWLTGRQSEFLRRFFATDTGQHFFLTGGTALAAFHLHHRVSVDLDLFTTDDLALREGEVLVPQLAADLGWQVARARRTEHYCEFLLEPGEGQAVKVDLVRDVGPQYGEHIRVANVIVDSMENIGANKLTAILGRTEPKDFVDLYFVLHAGHDLEDLLEKAKTKDLGLERFFLAGAMLQVRQFQQLPDTTPPLALAELRSFIMSLADSLLDQSRPPESSLQRAL